MASSGCNGEVRGVLRDGEIGDQPADDVIRDVGNSLLTSPSSTDELRTFLLMMESPISEPAKAKYPGNLASEVTQMSREPNVAYGEEMVNSRIMDWRPLDKTFYTGTVQSFDPLTKKHKIIYDDDDEEVLYLREERWELFDEKPRQIQFSHNEADHPSPAEEPANRTEKKISKRKMGSSRKQPAPASSKR